MYILITCVFVVYVDGMSSFSITCYLLLLFQLIDILVISYALVLLLHPEYTVVPTRYPDFYPSRKHHSDVASSTAGTDHAVTAAAVNLTTSFVGNTTSSLRLSCWTNCGLLHLVECFLVITV